VDFLQLGIGVLAAVMLAAGLATGRMPNAVIEPERTRNPIGFWSLAALYAFISGVLLLKAAAALLYDHVV
jgi:hypothetical protein